MSSSSYKGPGRIGSPDMDLEHDPRVRPDLLAALVPMGLAANSSMAWPHSYEDHENICKVSQEGFMAVYESMPNDLPGDVSEAEVETKEISIDSFDGNNIKLYVYRAKDSGDKALPAVIYIHGGGMVIMSTTAKPHLRWLKSLALKGVVAIGVDFRNAFQTDGKHVHFPTGLNDCAAAVKYVNAHKAELGVSKIVLEGESGGANGALATAIKAKREGWIDAIAGVYGYVPYISGVHDWPTEKKLKELPSLVENDGYFLNAPAMDGMAQFYTSKPEDRKNPLAWPYFATENDVRGLPPHVLVMDQLDPLRDEGIVYYHKLLAAGVRVTAEVNLGIVHAASLIFRKAMPDVYEKAVDRIAAFAKAV